MKIFILIGLFVAFVAASQELEVPTENNGAKKDEKTTGLLTPPENKEVSKPPNAIEPSTAKPLLPSSSPAPNTTKPKGKVIRHRKPSHKRPRYKHKGSKDHTRTRHKSTRRPMDLENRRPKHHHKSHKKVIHRVPKHIKPNNRHKRTNRRHDNDY